MDCFIEVVFDSYSSVCVGWFSESLRPGAGLEVYQPLLVQEPRRREEEQDLSFSELAVGLAELYCETAVSLSCRVSAFTPSL